MLQKRNCNKWYFDHWRMMGLCGLGVVLITLQGRGYRVCPGQEKAGEMWWLSSSVRRNTVWDWGSRRVCWSWGQNGGRATEMTGFWLHKGQCCPQLGWFTYQFILNSFIRSFVHYVKYYVWRNKNKIRLGGCLGGDEWPLLGVLRQRLHKHVKGAKRDIEVIKD